MGAFGNDGHLIYKRGAEPSRCRVYDHQHPHPSRQSESRISSSISYLLQHPLKVTMISKLLTVIPLLAMCGLPLVDAKCRLHNALEKKDKGVEKRKELCMGQGKGDWTFSMQLSEVSVPTFDGSDPYAGVAGHNAFIIYDNECNRKGVYAPDNEGSDCAIPYSISENWMPYEIDIKRVNFDVGGGDFRFSYGAGDYMIGENHATCSDMSKGLRAEVGCKTAFPLNGDGSN